MLRLTYYLFGLIAAAILALPMILALVTGEWHWLFAFIPAFVVAKVFRLLSVYCMDFKTHDTGFRGFILGFLGFLRSRREDSRNRRSRKANLATSMRSQLMQRAKEGDAGAQNDLGFLYQKSNDYAKAMKWYRRAARQGHADAQFNLGRMYAAPFRWDTAPFDFTKGTKWYRCAADQGHAGAQFNLGVMYKTGHGVPQDYLEAYKWFDLAVSRFGPGKERDDALKDRDAVAVHMAAEQVAEAQKRAREWKLSR